MPRSGHVGGRRQSETATDCGTGASGSPYCIFTVCAGQHAGSAGDLPPHESLPLPTHRVSSPRGIGHHTTFPKETVTVFSKADHCTKHPPHTPHPDANSGGTGPSICPSEGQATVASTAAWQSNVCSSLGRWRRSRPMSSGGVGIASGPSVICWCCEPHECDDSWWARVSWILQTSGRAVHKIVCIPAESLTPLETPDTYRRVPRRIFGNDGRIRPWSRV